jgi:hypothetical protein
MRLGNIRKGYNVEFQSLKLRRRSNRFFKTIPELANFILLELSHEKYVQSVSPEIFEYLYITNHQLLKLKDFSFAI